MEHTEVEDQIAAIIRTHACRTNERSSRRLGGVCHVYGSHNNITINIHCACSAPQSSGQEPVVEPRKNAL